MTEHAGGGGESFETLKRLKDTETAADAGIARLRREVAAKIAAEKERAEAYVVASRTAAESAREAALQRARADADAEAARILAEGTPGGDAGPALDAARRAKLVRAVLGEYAGGKNGSG